MAVLDTVSGLEVVVLVDKEPLKEIDTDEEDLPTKSVEKYIEAASGGNFEVKSTFTRPYTHSNHDVKVELFVDGKYMDNMLLSKNDLYGRTGHTFAGARVTDKKASNTFLHRFRFSELTIGKVYEAEPKVTIC